MSVDVDTKGLSELAREIEAAKRVLLARLAERGYQVLRIEVPYQTGNLRQGVAPPEVNYPQATLTVSARTGRTRGRKATVHLKSGETKSVTLKPTKAFNYAEAVARGRPVIRPKRGRALLIPVASAPSGESYLTIDGKIFVVRKSAKATKPNSYDERAAQRLEKDAPAIGEAVLREIFK